MAARAAGWGGGELGEALEANGLLVSPTGEPRGDNGVRRGRPRSAVSPQTERKFGLGLGRKRTESRHLSV